MLFAILIIVMLTFGAIKGGDDDQRNARSNKCLQKLILDCDNIEQEYFDYGYENCRNCLYCKDELTERERKMGKEEFYARSFKETSCVYSCEDYLNTCVLEWKPRSETKEIENKNMISATTLTAMVVITMIVAILCYILKKVNRCFYNNNTVKEGQKRNCAYQKWTVPENENEITTTNNNENALPSRNNNLSKPLSANDLDSLTLLSFGNSASMSSDNGTTIRHGPGSTLSKATNGSKAYSLSNGPPPAMSAFVPSGYSVETKGSLSSDYISSLTHWPSLPPSLSDALNSLPQVVNKELLPINSNDGLLVISYEGDNLGEARRKINEATNLNDKDYNVRLV